MNACSSRGCDVGGGLTFAQVVEQSAQFVRGLTLKQRLMVLGGALLVAGTLYVFVQLIGKPEYKTLYSGLNQHDTQTLTAQLKARNIPFELSADGNSVLVPADKLDSARLEMASQPLPNSGRMGFELFDKPNWAGSDFSEKVNYQRALEAELERSLGTMSEVEAARVHLVMPSESLYSEHERTAKASVMVRLRSSRLPEKSEAAIRQLVAGAVDRLSPDNVVVVDAETNQPLGRFGGRASDSENTELDQELARRVTATLEPVVGADGVRVSVHVERDPSSGEETQETYDPNSSVALSMTHTEERLGTDSLGGVPGTSSNLPNVKAPAVAKGDPQSHTSKTESGTYAVNRTVRHTVQPAGRIKRIAAALLVDDAIEYEHKSGQRVAVRRKRSAEEMKQIEELAKAALGIDASRGDLVAVENLSFQGIPQESLAPLTKTERLQRSLRNLTWLFRYAALACLFASVYLLLLRPVKKQILATFRELPNRIAATKTGQANSSQDAIPESAGALEDLLGKPSDADPTFKRLAVLKKHLVEKVKNEPAGATRLIQSWLHEGGVD